MILEDIKTKLNIEIPDSELAKMLEEAKTLIAMHTMGRSTQTEYLTDTQILAIEEAIIDQIEYWNYIDPNMDLVGMPVSVNVGGTKLDYQFPELAPRAKRHLSLCGLLTRRVKLR